jgi:hypothetical protein
MRSRSVSEKPATSPPAASVGAGTCAPADGIPWVVVAAWRGASRFKAHLQVSAALRDTFRTGAGWTGAESTAGAGIVARVGHGRLQPEHVAAVASELVRRTTGPDGAARLAERADLEPVAGAVLGDAFAGRVETDRKVVVPHWASAGRVDLVVRAEPGAERLAWLAELKWCGPRHDILYEGVWDLFKMALATKRDEHPRAYLIAGAETSLWQGSMFADLFDEQEHDPVELCLRRLDNRQGTLAWDAALQGGYDRYPDRVPARLRTSVRGRAPVDHWELRAVEVSMTGDRWVRMEGGWPHGRRPAGARRPA